MPESEGLHICFDRHSREIEILDATRLSQDTYRIDETPIFNPGIVLGDIIRVQEVQGIAYYVETVRKSRYRRFAWLLSQEAACSPELRAYKVRIGGAGGQVEQLFGGLLVVHIPADSLYDAEGEMELLLQRFKQ